MVRQIRIDKITLCMLIGLIAPRWGQAIELRGQLWGALTLGSDPATNYRANSELLGYIHTLSVRHSLGDELFIDGEWAYKGWFSTEVPVGENFLLDGKQHRLWARLAGEKFDLRVGLQRIAFGPGFILRPLAWFDTLDPRDPTGQTDGVEAVRVRLYPNEWLSLWGWVTRQESLFPQAFDAEFSPGGRSEIQLPFMDFGLTYHYNRNEGLSYFGQPPAATYGPEHRLALDLRADGMVGVWAEAVHSWWPGSGTLPNLQWENDLMMGGLDYTFAVGRGLYVLAEHLWHRRDYEIVSDKVLMTETGPVYTVFRVTERYNYTVFLASLPLGVFDQIMLIAQYDWRREMIFRFLQWQRTYDTISLNLLAYANPERKDFDLPLKSLPVALAGFGTGMQLMIIYHH